MPDLSDELRERVRGAFGEGAPIGLVGGGTKAFLGRLTRWPALEVGAHEGVVSYDPSELVVTARSGTRLDALEAVLDAEGQMLAFEPPRFGEAATLGGTVAAGLSGPRRPYAGAVRDFVLGVRMLNGRGEDLAFGGQVMKNVAGYDLSRLMTGSMGTLGVLLEISLKVLPCPGATRTLVLEMEAAQAIARMNALAGEPLPVSGAFHHRGRLHLRLSGTEGGVEAATRRIGGQPIDGEGPWEDLREHRLDFFQGTQPLWRLSVPSALPSLELPGEALVDWGGALRWLRSDADVLRVREAARAVGGHATLFRHDEGMGDVFHPLEPGVEALHRRLKAAFDPAGILNRGRMYASF